MKNKDCEGCALKDEAKVEPTLLPDSDILFVGQSPTQADINAGYMFSHKDRGGAILREFIDKLEVRYSVTMVLRCMTDKVKKKEMDNCTENLIRDISFTQPKLIVALGRSALHAVAGKNMSILKMNGKILTENYPPILACVSPAYVTEDGRNKAVFEKGILPAVKYFTEESPLHWYTKARIEATDEEVGFDIETNALRPHNGEIRCFAVSDGDNAIFVEVEDE